jgi:N-acetylmuramoyl-L-alanine amidase-like protein
VRHTTILVAAALLAGSAGVLPAPQTSVQARPLRPKIVENHIPFGHKRKRQMARYSRRHYGRARWRLRSPQVIVLHFTAGSRYSSAWNHFASNAPARGELPGVCAHFLIGKRGKTGELVPTTIRCRHAIGLNHKSVGVEMVQETGSGSHWAAQQILHRRRQIRAALRLVGYLKKRFDIRMRNIIGHAMANSSPYFKDLQGWKNDHTDWLKRDVLRFRRRLGHRLRT